MLVRIDDILRHGPAFMEAKPKDREKLKPGSVARKSAEAEASENAAEKRKDPEARRKAREKAAAKTRKKTQSQRKRTKQQSTARRQGADAEQAKGQKAREKIRKKSAGILRKKAGESEADRLRRVRAFGAKNKGRFRPKGPAMTKDGKKKVDKVPSQLAHCMLAVRFKRRKSTKAAWNICRWSLTKHGYLKPPYQEKGTVDGGATKQTRKGVRRSMQHSMEKKPLGGGIKGGGARKYDKFSRMFKAIEKDV